MNSKRFVISFISISLILVILYAIPTIYIDPFFHYHKPIEGISYRLGSERHHNDGILRNFDYDAVIIGTSMTQNFKSSEFDALFGVNSVKVPFAGAYFKELGDRLHSAYNSGNDIKYVILSLDLLSILADKNASCKYDYPDYLYDRNIFNDTYYLFNKTVLMDYTVRNILSTRANTPSTSFDDYSGWNDTSKFGYDAVMANYSRPAVSAESRVLSDAKLTAIRQNLEQNILSIIREHRETTFYCFLPPYSIAKMDSWQREKTDDYYFGTYRETAEILLEQENVRLFSFYDEYDMICNLDNYRDESHYAGWVNSYILECMADGRHELKKEDLDAHFDTVSQYYKDFDYTSIFSGTNEN